MTRYWREGLKVFASMGLVSGVLAAGLYFAVLRNGSLRDQQFGWFFFLPSVLLWTCYIAWDAILDAGNENGELLLARYRTNLAWWAFMGAGGGLLICAPLTLAFAERIAPGFRPGVVAASICMAGWLAAGGVVGGKLYARTHRQEKSGRRPRMTRRAAIDGFLDFGRRFAAFIRGVGYIGGAAILGGGILWLWVTYLHGELNGWWPLWWGFAVLWLIGCGQMLFFGIREWRMAFPGRVKLDQPGVHGKADLADEKKAADAARKKSEPESAGGLDLNY